MGITSAIVLFAVIWFMTFLVVLPMRLKTQGESGEVVPGTHVSAPSNLDLRGKVRNTTIVAVILWIIIAGVILSGAITVRDMDWFNQLPPAR